MCSDAQQTHTSVLSCCIYILLVSEIHCHTPSGSETNTTAVTLLGSHATESTVCTAVNERTAAVKPKKRKGHSHGLQTVGCDARDSCLQALDTRTRVSVRWCHSAGRNLWPTAAHEARLSIQLNLWEVVAHRQSQCVASCVTQERRTSPWTLW